MVYGEQPAHRTPFLASAREPVRLLRRQNLLGQASDHGLGIELTRNDLFDIG